MHPRNGKYLGSLNEVSEVKDKVEAEMQTLKDTSMDRFWLVAKVIFEVQKSVCERSRDRQERRRLGAVGGGDVSNASSKEPCCCLLSIVNMGHRKDQYFPPESKLKQPSCALIIAADLFSSSNICKNYGNRIGI